MPMRAHVSITPAECNLKKDVDVEDRVPAECNLKKDIDVEDRPGTECLAGQSPPHHQVADTTQTQVCVAALTQIILGIF